MKLIEPRGTSATEDHSPWSRLVQQCSPQVVSSLLARGVAFHDAVELTQLAWARLWEQQVAGKLTQFPVPALAVSQARFLALEAYRQGRGRDQVPLSEAAEVPDERPSADDRVVSMQTLVRLRAALQQCTPSQRRVFEAVMRSPGATAEALGRELQLSTQRVRQVMCEVRQKLRLELERDDD